MDEALLRKVCEFLKKQKDNEAVFQTFWEGTKEYYPSDFSKKKVEALLKEHPECFEIIKSETGNPFGKIKLKIEASNYVLPSTTRAEDFEIAQKLIESIDNREENGHLFANICKNKAQIFPEKLRDKKHIRKWLAEHEKWFKGVKDATGGLFSVEVLGNARHLMKSGLPLLPVLTSERKDSRGKTAPQKAKDDTDSVDLLEMADNITLRISGKLQNEGGTIPFESLLKAKDVIYPLCEEEALISFLAAFPLKFEIIDLEGLGKWVHLKGTKDVSANDASANDAISKVTSFIFQNGGTIPFTNLVKQADTLIGKTVHGPQILSAWLNTKANIFEIVPKPDDPSKPGQVKVKLSFFLRFCQHYITHGQCPKNKCQFLHICKAFVCQRPHNNEDCKLSHDIRDAHNKVIVDKMGALSKETDAVVINVLLESCFPHVCPEYNNKNGACPRGDKCHFLHICGDYVLNQCGNPFCPLSHDVVDDLHNINLLKKYALLPSQKLSVELVKANIAYVKGMKSQPSQIAISEKTCLAAGDLGNIAVPTSGQARPLLSFENIWTFLTQKVESWMRSPTQQEAERGFGNPVQRKQSDSTLISKTSHVSNRSSIVSSESSVWHDDFTQKVDIPAQEIEEVTHICPQFLMQQCCHKKCSHVHFTLPYCWQLKLSRSSWQSFDNTDCENIEKYFCDVNCTAAELNISTNIPGYASSVRLDFQSMSIHFSAGEDFKIRRLECRQRKTQYGREAWYETPWMWYELESTGWIKCETSKAHVFEKLFLDGSFLIDWWSSHRRRPAAFLTESEVREKKRSTQLEQQMTEVRIVPPPRSPMSSRPPPTSDPVRETAFLQPPNCYRTRVKPGSLEYKEIERLLGSSTSRDIPLISQIEKIVSDALWDKYKSKKKSMTDELRIGENLNDCRLFIPCLSEDIEGIMRGNIHDCSISRILPKPFGPRYYFTSNASLCIQWCREYLAGSQVSLIVCQVLLGSSTQGSHGLKEFPRRHDGKFYDSLVDNIDDPSVFVIENIDQCYPAFVLDILYAATPVMETQAMLQGKSKYEVARPKSQIEKFVGRTRNNTGMQCPDCNIELDLNVHRFCYGCGKYIEEIVSNAHEKVLHHYAEFPIQVFYQGRRLMSERHRDELYNDFYPIVKSGYEVARLKSPFTFDDSETEDGQTALYWAARRGDGAMVANLLEKGAQVDARDKHGQTALHWAAIHRGGEMLANLLEKGAQVDARDKEGQTALHWAARCGRGETVANLLEKGAQVDACDKHRQTALHWAAKIGYDEIVANLLEKGAEVDAKDKDGQTALHWAARRGRDEIVANLLEKGAQVDARDKDEQTALHWASKIGYGEIVGNLLEKGAQVDASDKDGQTALHWAVKNGNDEIVANLLEKGAQVYARDKDGQTALHWAVKNGDDEIVANLLEKGAQVYARDKDGQTAFRWAASTSNGKMAENLLEKGAQVYARHMDKYLWTDSETEDHDVDFLKDLTERTTGIQICPTEPVLKTMAAPNDMVGMDQETKKPAVNQKPQVKIERENNESPEIPVRQSKAEEYQYEMVNTNPLSDVSDSEYSFFVGEVSGLTFDNSITINEEGGCFRVPVASAFLLFPPKAVEKEVILTCNRVKHEKCEVKPRDGDLFVSRILCIEPEGVTFKKPVTVLLSHSVYEDQVFEDFYELIIEHLSQNRWQDLKTERISSIQDIPKEILNPEILGDYLPIAKTTIHETCTLVAATRVRYDQILIPTDSSYIFSKQCGENAELNITFPAGVTEEILSLKVQLFPADAALKKEVYLDKNLVCAPVIKVSGQTTPFLKAVDVELTYSNNDVANIEEGFLPVGKSIKFSTEYGLLLRSRKETESRSKCQTLNESNDVYIERLRKDQLKFSFSLKHFCKICSIAKKTDSAQLPHVEENSLFNQCMSQNDGFVAIILAVHQKKTLYAVLAPKTAQDELKKKWKVAGRRLGVRLRKKQEIYICVPLDKDTTHLPLDDELLWFDLDMEFELPNGTSEDVDLEEEYMYFLLTKCTGKNHNIGKDGCGKVGIHIEKKAKGNIKSVNEPCIARRQGNGVLSTQGVALNGLVTSQNEVMETNLSRCEYFEEAIENIFLKKLGINKDEMQNPHIGSMAKAVNDLGTLTSIVLGLGVGATIALSIANFGIGAIVGATVAGVTFTVTKVDRKLKKSTAKKLDKKVEIYFHSHLKCIIMDVAKELSRMFEYQVLTLEDGKQIDILAECAVDLMSNLKKDDKFDRNTLIKKVLKDGKVEKRDLLTRIGDKWSAPDVFRKPGLQRAIVETDRAKFIYQVKPNNACNTTRYGYRGQFLETKKYHGQNEVNEKVSEMRYRREPPKDETHTRENSHEDLCKECSSNFENGCSGQYFGESDIDSQYTEYRDELSTYHPMHILIQCPKVLESFIGSQLQGDKPSLANFLKKKLELPEHHLVHPVYRQHSPGKVPDLQKSDLTGSDFSHSNFTNSSLTECYFVKCVMLFVRLAGAKMSGSKFCDTLISHSNLVKAEADQCEWIKTAILYSNVAGAYLNFVEPSICGNYLDGTNICDAITGKMRKDEGITGKMRELNCNETPV